MIGALEMFTQQMTRHGAICLAIGLSLSSAFAQTPVMKQTTPAQLSSTESASRSVIQDMQEGKTDQGEQNASSVEEELRQMRQLIEQMRQLIERQEARISRLEAEKNADAAKQASTTDNAAQASKAISPTAMGANQSKTSTLSKDDRETLDFWRDTTVNLTVDGYYGYNFNRPRGGINLLRANDVLSNSFSLNQATAILEQAPNVEGGRRWGARLDLMFGQQTETVQGSIVNERRPWVYRHIWQAYGTYVAPLGKGLTVDFGKFASSLGFETNYAKDNFNYSRSFFFLFLPFYHMGFRAKYPINDKLTVLYHLVNGANQTEDFNGFKSQHFAVAVKPTERISTQFNYYFGREQRVRTSILSLPFPILPTQPGLSPFEIRPVRNGRLHILDAYATFNVTDKLTFGLEGDYVINRDFDFSPPSRVTGLAAYARYQFTPHIAMAGRFEYLSDRGGLFSNETQALKEQTVTAEYKFGEGFLLRGEYRRDWSNIPFFLTDRFGRFGLFKLADKPDKFKKEQNTVTLGLIWWWGRKKDPW
jgi:putative OmpL-like beta-barrel porin-2